MSSRISDLQGVRNRDLLALTVRRAQSRALTIMSEQKWEYAVLEMDYKPRLVQEVS